MWCVGQITAEYRQRMYALLELYARPHDPRAPVICVDEKSKQLLEPTRPALPAKPGAVAKEDYEYARAGTCNIFVAVEPKGGRRHTAVTARRAKPDFVVAFIHLRALGHRVWGRRENPLGRGQSQHPFCPLF